MARIDNRSHRRVVADVLAGGVDVGAAMDAAGWSKAGCPKRWATAGLAGRARLRILADKL